MIKSYTTGCPGNSVFKALSNLSLLNDKMSEEDKDEPRVITRILMLILCVNKAICSLHHIYPPLETINSRLQILYCQRYQESWSWAMFGFLYSWFLVLMCLWISWTKTQTLPNSRIPDTSVYCPWRGPVFAAHWSKRTFCIFTITALYY